MISVLWNYALHESLIVMTLSVIVTFLSFCIGNRLISCQFSHRWHLHHQVLSETFVKKYLQNLSVYLLSPIYSFPRINQSTDNFFHRTSVVAAAIDIHLKINK